MNLFRRMSDIVSANLHEMVERFGDPQTMLKQAIREMESTIAATLDRAVEVVAQEKLLGKQIDGHRSQIARGQTAAEQAVAGGDDARARRALVRCVEHRQLLAVLEHDQRAAAALGSRLRSQIDAMRAKLAEARRRLATLAARQQLAAARRHMAQANCCVGDAPFAAFERVAARIEQAEAEAGAYEELSGSWWPAEETEPIDLEVDLELAALKERLH